MKIYIPKFCLVILIGSSGSGKSTFARKNFIKTEIVSSDFCRALVCDDENNQFISEHAFDVFHLIIEKRLVIGRLAVADATNVQEYARRELLKLANRNNCRTAAIVFNISEKICRDRDKQRTDRQVGGIVIRNHAQILKRSISNLSNEGFNYIYMFNSPEEVDNIEIIREG